MKNRYLLLLITLITGLIQASDSLKELTSLPVVYKAIEDALPKDHTVAKMAAAVYAQPARLTQDEQEREATYTTTYNYLAQHNIKPEYANWYLKTTENLMLAEGQKYDSDFGSRFKSWRLGSQWEIKRKTYCMPGYYMDNIITDPKLNSSHRRSFHHERGHDYLEHSSEEIAFLEHMLQKKNFAQFYLAKTKEEFLQISNKKELLEDLVSYHFFCIEHEKEADAFVPDDPALLAAGVKYFTFLAQNLPTTFNLEHPSHTQRAKYFRDRFKIVTKLQNEDNLDSSIASYANDFQMIITHSDSNSDDNTGSEQHFLFPDEYSVYLTLKPIVLESVQFYE